ncbi:MAG: hypothetical protein Q9159_003042 [Coniocarpon cinnabarinum]
MPSTRTQTHIHTHPDLGCLQGTQHLHPQTNHSLCQSYTSIPYALPPRRFRRATALPRNHHYGTPSHPYDATAPCPVSPQPAFPGTVASPDESSQSENCLNLSVYVPSSPAPKEGWPILIFIHGGWLQIGTPNSIDPVALLGRGIFRGIVIAPAYRLNVFGFLAARQLQRTSVDRSVGNLGFWDQRLAIEWVVRYGDSFGGNVNEVTVAGYSAGAHSAFQQLAHELYYVPHSQRIIKRVVMHSNGPGPQAKSLELAQGQFDEVCHYLGVDTTKSDEEVVKELEDMSMTRLNQAARNINMTEFRAVTDGHFINPNLFEDILSGSFARRVDAAGVQLLIGECRDERHIYAAWRPPTEDTLSSLQTRLYADYNPAIIDALLREHYTPSSRLQKSSLHPSESVDVKTWHQIFGAIYADLQVHALQRGFLSGFEKALGRRAGEVVKRYRIEWRASVVSGRFPEEWGVTHGTDMAIWLFGNGMGDRTHGLEGRDEEVVRATVEPVMRWIEGRPWRNGTTSTEDGSGFTKWNTGSIKQARRLRSDGTIDVWHDIDWNRGIKVCELIGKAQKNAEKPRARL